MTNITSRIIKSYISCHLNLPFLYWNTSYSQDGEDLIIDRYFKQKSIKNGFYVDIGAYHPFKFSNTQKLYQKGWSGINIEPNENNIKLFKIARKRDINLNFALGVKNDSKKYYIFEDEALNTFNYSNYKAVITSGQSKFIRSEVCTVKSIKYVIRKFIKNIKVDFLNIDAEGLSYSIVKAFLKEEINPDVICLEREDMGEKLNMNNNITRILSKYNYHITTITNMSYVFTRSTISQR